MLFFFFLIFKIVFLKHKISVPFSLVEAKTHIFNIDACDKMPANNIRHAMVCVMYFSFSETLLKGLCIYT